MGGSDWRPRLVEVRPDGREVWEGIPAGFCGGFPRDGGCRLESGHEGPCKPPGACPVCDGSGREYSVERRGLVACAGLDGRGCPHTREEEEDGPTGDMFCAYCMVTVDADELTCPECGGDLEELPEGE